ncbi:RNA polymerase sigma factor [Paenibacillus sp. CAU 1782]
MTRVHEQGHVYPDEYGTLQPIEAACEQYRKVIRTYFSLKVSDMAAEDLTQQTFLRAIENIRSFNGNSSLFTWIFKIAQNTAKNEYRSRSRKNEYPYDFTAYESQSISLDFAQYVEIRVDISAALKKLNELDQQIISLRFFVDCTLSDISAIVGMRESAVKNRLYRALEKLRSQLNEWGDIAMKSIQDMVAIVNKDAGNNGGEKQEKVHADLFNELKGSVERLTAKYSHKPSQKIIIEIFPDLATFHQAAGQENAPDWFMGTFKGRYLKIVSPLNPGPQHTYQSILTATVHLYTMWLVRDINPEAPVWLIQGIGGIEAKSMSKEETRKSVSHYIQKMGVPTFRELNDESWDFGTKGGFQFTYLIVDFIVAQYGQKALNQLIRNPDDFQGIFQQSEQDLQHEWEQYLNRG